MSESVEAQAAGRGLSKFIVLVLTAQICALFLRAWTEGLLSSHGMASWPAKNLAYFVEPPLLLILLYPVWKRSLRSLKSTFRLSALSIASILVGVTIGIFLRVIFWSTLVAQGGLGLIFYDAAFTPIFISFNCPTLFLILLHLIVMSVFTPLTEETINRAWLAEWFREFGIAKAIFCSSLLFAILHSPSGFPMAFLFGLFAAKIYLDTRSIWVPLIAHATYNALIVVDWYCLTVSWTPAPIDSTSLGVGCTAIVIALLALGACSYLASKRVTGRLPGDLPD